MKTAKPPVAEPSAGSSRRAQPVRRTRTNPARATAPANGPNALNGGHNHDQPIDIFPAVTHFTDAITALPKELVRHFTLLKEVDAKIFAPEESLFKLIEAALDAPHPDPPRSVNDASSSVALASAPMSAQNSSTGVPFNGHFPAVPSNDEPTNSALFDPSNLPRRQLFRQTAFKIQEMLVSLEEKNHVISTANEALQKQIGRIEDLWPHLKGEFSDEAKWGSATHWAYLENRVAKANNNSQAERSRREGAAALSAAAQQVAEEAAARSSDRKQALAAKKNSKNNQANDADGDGKPQEQAPRKSQNMGKSRKPPGEPAGGVGLGISNPATANGANPAPKRRKVEYKQANNSGGAAAENAMSSVFGASAAKPKTTSPSGTPAPEGTKKRKALPTSSTHTKKSRTTAAAMSPSVTGSPIVGTFPADISKVARSSPAPSSTARPSSSRARPATAQSQAVVDAAKPSPAATTTTAPSKPDDLPAVTPDAPVQTNGTRAASEAKIPKEAPAPRPGVIKAESEPQIGAPPPAVPDGGRKESTSKPPAEESEARKESNTPIVPPKPQPQVQPPASPVTTTTPVMNKSGRASKPSTPSLGTFAEAATARSRPSRSSENPSSQPKRSHKKGASAAAAAAAAAAMAQAAAAKEVVHAKADSGQEDEDDGDEPTYCYCNNVSYGEMVACDANGCKREWFHLECVGLKVAPKGNAKWYCEDCKKRLRLSGKTVNGR